MSGKSTLPTNVSDLNRAETESPCRASQVTVDMTEEINAANEAACPESAQPVAEAVKEAVNVKNACTAEQAKKVEAKETGSNFTVIACVVMFLIADVGKNVVEVQGVKGTGVNTTFATIVYSLLSLVIAPVITFYFNGTDGLKKIVQWDSLKMFVLPAIIFSLSQAFNMMVSGYLDAGTKKVLSQLRMPLTALFGRFIMGNGYTKLQWVALACIVVSSSAYLSLKDASVGKAAEGSANFMKGLFFALAGNVAAVVGSLVAEKLLKAQKSTPFYIQKAQIEFWQIVTAVFTWAFLSPWVIAYVVDEFSYGSFHLAVNPTTRKQVFALEAKHIDIGALNLKAVGGKAHLLDIPDILAMVEKKTNPAQVKINNDKAVYGMNETFASAQELTDNFTLSAAELTTDADAKVASLKKINVNAANELHGLTFTKDLAQKKAKNGNMVYYKLINGKTIKKTEEQVIAKFEEVLSHKDLQATADKDAAQVAFDKINAHNVQFSKDLKEATLKAQKTAKEALLAADTNFSVEVAECEEAVKFTAEAKAAKAIVCKMNGADEKMLVFPGKKGLGSDVKGKKVVNMYWDAYTASPLAGWGPIMLLACFFTVLQSWSSGMVSKVLSSLMKNICSAVAMCIIVYVDELLKLFQGKGFNTDMRLLVGVLGVFGSALVFVLAPKAPKK